MGAVNGNGGSLVDAGLRDVPAHNAEAERATLGAVLLENAVLDLVSEKLRPDDFYCPKLGTIFRVMLELHGRREPIDSLTLVHALRERGDLDRVGGPTAVSELESVVPTSANAEYYAELVATAAHVRRARLALLAADRCLSDASRPVPERIADVERMVLEATGAGARVVDPELAELLPEVFQRIEGAATTRGIPSGFVDLDVLTLGFRPGDVTLVAARPSVGKSTFALNVLRHAVADGDRVRDLAAVLFSLEMPAVDLAHNLLCQLARVNAHEARAGRLPKAEVQRLYDWSSFLERLKLRVIHRASLTVGQLASLTRRLRAERRADLVVVDYVQLLTSPSARTSRPRHEEVAEISRGLKALATELAIPVVALAQLNREVESRSDQRPRLADIRESGSLEQDAAVVLLLHRSSDLTKLQVIVAKNRYGPRGEVTFAFDAATGVLEGVASP